MPPALIDILTQLRRHLPDLTIHAGELAGHDSVDRTLALDPRGIGHGVRSLESPATLERLAAAGVTLEVCPTSNHLLINDEVAAITRMHAAAPLPALQRAGVHCVLGSDDPTPMGTSFRHELEVARAIGVDLAKLEADARRRWTEMTGQVLQRRPADGGGALIARPDGALIRVRDGHEAAIDGPAVAWRDAILDRDAVVLIGDAAIWRWRAPAPPTTSYTAVPGETIRTAVITSDHRLLIAVGAR